MTLSGKKYWRKPCIAIAIASGLGPAKIAYCGKHMLFGEMLASTVINGITSSLGGASLLKDPL